MPEKQSEADTKLVKYWGALPTGAQFNKTLREFLAKYFEKLHKRLLLKGAVSQTALEQLRDNAIVTLAHLDELMQQLEAEPNLTRSQVQGRINSLKRRLDDMALKVRFIRGRLDPREDPSVTVNKEAILVRIEALKNADVHELARIGEIIDGLAHDLNNMLTVAIGSAGILELKDFPADKVMEYLTRVRSGVSRVLRDSEEHFKGVTTMQSAGNLPEILDGLKNDLASKIHIDFTVENGVTPERPFNISESQLQRLLFDLLDNAHKYGVHQPKATIKVKVMADGLEITLKDNGPGFGGRDPLTASKQSRQKSSTNGKGLPVCFQICEGAGGKLALKDKHASAEWLIKIPYLNRVALPKSKKVP